MRESESVNLTNKSAFIFGQAIDSKYESTRPSFVSEFNINRSKIVIRTIQYIYNIYISIYIYIYIMNWQESLW